MQQNDTGMARPGIQACDTSEILVTLLIYYLDTPDVRPGWLLKQTKWAVNVGETKLKPSCDPLAPVAYL